MSKISFPKKEREKREREREEKTFLKEETDDGEVPSNVPPTEF